MSRLSLRSSFFGGSGFTLFHAWGDNGAKRYAPHFHGEYTVSLQLRGYEELKISGKTEGFAPGDIALINPLQVHTGNDHESREVEYVSLYIDPSIVADVAREIQAPQSQPEFTVVRTHHHPRLAGHVMHMLRLVQQRAMRTANRSLRPTALMPGQMAPLDSIAQAEAFELESTMHTLVVELFEPFSNLRCSMLRTTNRIAHRKIARAVDYLRDHSQPLAPTLGPDGNPIPVPELSLDALAAVAGLSKYHFLRQFAEVVGMTPGAYLRSLRLCHAARRLRENDSPILDIALSVGFADHPSFSRAFARYMGMTPSEYQRLAWA
jgi:AraC-like DNA-binding protein